MNIELRLKEVYFLILILFFLNMNFKIIYPVSKLVEFFVKLLHIKEDTKTLSSLNSYKTKEEEYESWLGV